MSNNENNIMDLKQQNDLAEGLIQKLERIKELWGELSSEDDLEDLEKHAHGLAGCLERARETYTDEDFPTGEALQELAREGAILAESVERSAGDDSLDKEAEPNMPRSGLRATASSAHRNS